MATRTPKALRSVALPESQSRFDSPSPFQATPGSEIARESACDPALTRLDTPRVSILAKRDLAGVAQWQSSCFVNSRSLVRSQSPAPLRNKWWQGKCPPRNLNFPSRTGKASSLPSSKSSTCCTPFAHEIIREHEAAHFAAEVPGKIAQHDQGNRGTTRNSSAP